MNAVTAVPLLFLLFIGWILLTLVRPVRCCPRCKGRRSVQGRGKAVPCPKCKATGKAPRTGARIVHRVVREHAWPWLRDRIADRLTRDDAP